MIARWLYRRKIREAEKVAREAQARLRLTRADSGEIEGVADRLNQFPVDAFARDMARALRGGSA